MTTRTKKVRPSRRRVRYAVVGLGYISQIAVLPAFAHARKNSEVVALVSGDDKKRKTLARKYGVETTCGYDEYERLLREGGIDAVYIATPNHVHAEQTIAAAHHGVHVLCEKPMAVSEEECQRMIDACERHRVKLMIAYRLHFEAANLAAVEMARSGKLGEVRIFQSTFSNQVRAGNIRLRRETGGGTLYDIGIYCINAARYLFGNEPEEVYAVSVKGRDERFEEVDEMTTAVLRFPEDRIASFTCSFGASEVSSYQLVGTRASLRVEPAYELADALEHHLTRNGTTRTRVFRRRDQFAPELFYFSNCVLEDKEPEPGGTEGLIDVRIINALYESAERSVPLAVTPIPAKSVPTLPSGSIGAP